MQEVKHPKPVLIVTYQYPPHGGSSGVLRSLKFSKFLPEFGFLPHILTLRESLYRVRDESLRREVPPTVTVHRTFAFDSSRHFAIGGRYPQALAVPDPIVPWVPFGVARGLNVIRRHGIRALFSTSPPATTHLIAAVLHRLTGLPWIADFRDPWIEEGLHPRPGTVRERLEKRLERRVLHAATRITVTTPRLRAEILQRHPDLDGDRVVVIYNGYDESDFPESLDAQAAPRFEVLHAGFVTPEFRDPFPLLGAMERMIQDGRLARSESRVVFLGAGPYVSSAGFRERLAGMDLDGVVDIAERLPHDEAMQRQGKAAVLLLLQASEDTRSLIPAKAFEYLRLGRPILALTLDGDTADLLRGLEQCHVVDPADAPSLEAAILSLYRHWRERNGRVSVRRSVEVYDRRHLTSRLAGVLDEIS